MPLFVKGQPRPPGSGRKKGQPDRATIARRAAEAAGLKEQLEALKSKGMPLEFLLRTMRSHQSAPADRFLAARAAAPYCHAQLGAIARCPKQSNRTSGHRIGCEGPFRGAHILSPLSAFRRCADKWAHFLAHILMLQGLWPNLAICICERRLCAFRRLYTRLIGP